MQTPAVSLCSGTSLSATPSLSLVLREEGGERDQDTAPSPSSRGTVLGPSRIDQNPPLACARSLLQHGPCKKKARDRAGP